MVEFIFVLNAALLLKICTPRVINTRLHTINGAEVALDGLLQGAISELTSTLRLGREVLPEQGVVDVSCSIVSSYTVKKDTRTHLRR